MWVFKNKLKCKVTVVFFSQRLHVFFTCSFYFHIDGFLSITIYKSTERKELSSCSVE